MIGLKAFMSNSGIDEFAHVDDVTLYEGMAIAARLGLLVAVHAENDALTARSLGPSARDWFASRPVVAELEAISPGDRCSPRRPAARCTSCTSPAGAASRWSAEARAAAST